MPHCRKAYRFRLYPTPRQEQAMLRQAGARRWTWNWALRRWKDYYAATGKSPGLSMLSRELTALKDHPATAWLREVQAQPLQQVLRDLKRSYERFFNHLNKIKQNPSVHHDRRMAPPKFKSRKHSDDSFRCPQRIRLTENRIYVPKIGWIKVRLSQPITELIKSATFKRRPDGSWHVSLVVDFEMPDVPLAPPDPSLTVGIDLGLKDFAVLSAGERVAAPKFYRQAQRILRRAQRTLSRRQQGSKRREKAKRLVAKIHQKIADKRGDFLHKLTTRLVVDHDALCIEDLSLKGLARTKLAKSFADASMGEFRRQLTYKAEWSRKHLVVIDRWFPSTRLCRGCGTVNRTLTLNDRAWICECGLAHDRDLNAAFNIQQEGLRQLAAGHVESQNARGACVSPTLVGAGC